MADFVRPPAAWAPDSLPIGPPEAGGPLPYELYAALVHSGSPQHGHFYALIKDLDAAGSANGGDGSGEWHEYNDACVKEIKESGLKRKAFGGEGGDSLRTRDRHSSAYMLLYRARGAHGGEPTPPSEDAAHTPPAMRTSAHSLLTLWLRHCRRRRRRRWRRRRRRRRRRSGVASSRRQQRRRRQRRLSRSMPRRCRGRRWRRLRRRRRRSTTRRWRRRWRRAVAAAARGVLAWRRPKRRWRRRRLSRRRRGPRPKLLAPLKRLGSRRRRRRRRRRSGWLRRRLRPRHVFDSKVKTSRHSRLTVCRRAAVGKSGVRSPAPRPQQVRSGRGVEERDGGGGCAGGTQSVVPPQKQVCSGRGTGSSTGGG